MMEKEIFLTHEGLSVLKSKLDFELKTYNLHDAIKWSKSQISFLLPFIDKLLQNDQTTND